MSHQTKLVLRALLAQPAQSRNAWELCRIAGLPSGTLYSILAGLELCGWLESGWEDKEPTGWPRRRFYRLTQDGAQRAREALAPAPARRSWLPAWTLRVTS